MHCFNDKDLFSAEVGMKIAIFTFNIRTTGHLEVFVKPFETSPSFLKDVYPMN